MAEDLRVDRERLVVLQSRCVCRMGVRLCESNHVRGVGVIMVSTCRDYLIMCCTYSLGSELDFVEEWKYLLSLSMSLNLCDW